MKLKCVCGKVLTVPDEMSGKMIRCKTCGKVMKLLVETSDATPSPKDETVNDPLAVRGHRRCGSCGRSWPMRDKICTVCGIDLDSGAALYVSVDTKQVKIQQEKPSLLGRLRRLFGKRE